MQRQELGARDACAHAHPVNLYRWVAITVCVMAAASGTPGRDGHGPSCSAAKCGAAASVVEGNVVEDTTMLQTISRPVYNPEKRDVVDSNEMQQVPRPAWVEDMIGVPLGGRQPTPASYERTQQQPFATMPGDASAWAGSLPEGQRLEALLLPTNSASSWARDLAAQSVLTDRSPSEASLAQARQTGQAVVPNGELVQAIHELSSQVLHLDVDIVRAINPVEVGNLASSTSNIRADARTPNLLLEDVERALQMPPMNQQDVEHARPLSRTLAQTVPADPTSSTHQTQTLVLLEQEDGSFIRALNGTTVSNCNEVKFFVLHLTDTCEINKWFTLNGKIPKLIGFILWLLVFACVCLPCTCCLLKRADEW